MKILTNKLKPSRKAAGRAGAAGKGRIWLMPVLVVVALGGWYLFTGKPADGPTAGSEVEFPPMSQPAPERRAPETIPAESSRERTPASTVGNSGQTDTDPGGLTGLVKSVSAPEKDAGKTPPASRQPTAVFPDSPEAPGHQRAKITTIDPTAATTPPTAVDSALDTARGDRARVVIAQLRKNGGEVDVDELFARAERFRGAGMLADAHILYFFAARRGHARSAMVLGTMYDPSYHSNITSIMDDPDLGQAHKWYLQAANGGDMVAKEHLHDLRARVERAAAGGDQEAARLRLQWK